MQKNTNRLVLLLLIAAVVIGLALRLVLSYLSINNLPPSSDDSLAQLLAESISNGESLPLLFTGQPYQFPLEAYLMSVFVDFFQHGAFAARIQLIILSAVSLLILCIVVTQVFKEGERWPALLLLLIPSAYWLIHQSGNFVPQYTASALLSALIFLVAVKLNQRNQPMLMLTLFSGMLLGLAISNHLLVVSVVVGAVAIILFVGDIRLFLSRSIVITIGLVIGLIPYLLAIFTIEGAYDAISDRTNFQLTGRLYHLVIKYALPGALGVYPPFYPDYPAHINWGIPLRSPFALGFVALLIFCVSLSLAKFVKSLKINRWPSLQSIDMFIITTIISLVLMAMNQTIQATDHRYVLPAVWSFPFLIGYVYSVNFRLLRSMVVICTGLILALNIVTSLTIIKEWRQPAKIQKHADIPDLTAMTSWMEEQNINYCYATFWLAYKFTYETNKAITCGPIYNERFNGWPVPYKHEVDKQTNVAFVLSDTPGSKFPFYKFEQYMRYYKIEYQRMDFGDYFVYFDFNYELAKGEQLLSSEQLNVTSNLSNIDLALLTDADTEEPIRPSSNQAVGQFIELELPQPQYVQRVDLVHALSDRHPAAAVTIWGKKDNVWIKLSNQVEFEVDRLRFDNHHPIFGEFSQSIRFNPAWISGIRIELTAAQDAKTWALSEVRVGIQTNH